jgi:hypothetical protein
MTEHTPRHEVPAEPNAPDEREEPDEANPESGSTEPECETPRALRPSIWVADSPTSRSGIPGGTRPAHQNV